MSHKAGHIIIQALYQVPSLTTEQRAALQEIERRDEYTFMDRCYVSMVVMVTTARPSIGIAD